MTSESGEIWMPIPNLPYYQASSRGRIRSLTRWVCRAGVYVLREGMVLTPRENTTGRLQVSVYQDSKAQSRSVHSLVCEAFYGPKPEDKPFACHLNGDHLDNRPENLYWGSPTDNAQDTIRHGRNHLANRTHCIRGHEYTENNTYLRPDRRGRQCRKCIKVRGNTQQDKTRLKRNLRYGVEDSTGKEP